MDIKLLFGESVKIPKRFMDAFGLNIAKIIDYFKVFIDRPNLLARANFFPSYKHHNTVKVFIGINPQVTISFVSKLWGDWASDKFPLTENCSLLQNLLPEDLVLVDRGFTLTIQEGVQFYQAEINVSALTKRKSQLHITEVEKKT